MYIQSNSRARSIELFLARILLHFSFHFFPFLFFYRFRFNFFFFLYMLPRQRVLDFLEVDYLCSFSFIFLFSFFHFIFLLVASHYFRSLRTSHNEFATCAASRRSERSENSTTEKEKGANGEISIWRNRSLYPIRIIRSGFPTYVPRI